MPNEYRPTGRPRLSPEARLDINHNAIKLGLNTLGLVTCFAGLSFLDPSLRPVFIGGGIACINNMAGALAGIARHYSRSRMFPILYYSTQAINLGIFAAATLEDGLFNQNLPPQQINLNTGLFYATGANLVADLWAWGIRLTSQQLNSS